MMRKDDDGSAELERAFDETAVPPWWKQITVRAIVTSFILSILFNVIVCKLNLTTGIVPSLNVAAGLLGFAIIKTWTVLLEKCGYLKQPFTRQENTVIQTCIIASSGIAFSSGTGSYLLGMSPLIASQAETGNTPLNVKKLSLGWIIAFLYLVSFVGLFAIVPLRRMMILRYKLTYPSGTATAYLINSFHTPKGARTAKKKVWTLFKAFGGSFLWACFQWFFTAADGCGFSSMPTFGRTAFKKRFYFDFSATYVGVGMLCPYMINISLLIGAIISWALMWPAIESKEGDWYEAGLPGNSLHGIQGYRVFIAVATILGDGVFQVLYMLCRTLWALRGQLKQPNPLAKTDKDKEDELKQPNPLAKTEEDQGEGKGKAKTEEDQGEGNGEGEGGYDEMRRKEYFLKDEIPILVAIGGYIVLALLSTFLVPLIFHQLKWYYIIVVYVFAPIFAFCNSYGAGLTDWSLASNYGKIAILVVSASVGLDHGGVIAGLASCGVMMSIVSTASDLMQDFRTGYLTLSSPRAMFASQVLGTAMGCTISPLVFWFFYKAYSVGDPNGAYPAPFAGLYRGMALLGVEGLSALPKNCWKFALVCFCAAIAINGVTELLKMFEEKKFEKKWRIYEFIPRPMCMAIPFYLGGYFAIDMCVGSLILFVWQCIKKKQAKEMGPAVASGLICGDSLWGIPAAVLSLLGAKPPVCMKFW